MPRSRSRAAEEDDDRPRRRRRDADLDDRPSRRDHPPRRPISPAKILGVSIGVFVLVVVVVIVVLILDKTAKKPAGSELLDLVPADTVVLSGFDLVQLSENEPYRKALERRAPPDLAELDRAGLRTIEMSRVLIARTLDNGNACVVRFRAGPDRNRYLGADLPGKR